MSNDLNFYINGEWVKSESNETIDVINPANEEVIGQVAAGSTIFDVDSTVGFPISGELFVEYNDEKTGVVSYTSKNLTQFFGCSNVTGILANA